ncbi:MAG: GDP-mannose 4,6-dehydratase [Candidatus Caenarcaniphilales bacterium]|nr:GDP-mannose 4,6-dehydratase [Candidatus Caenarcaniphilales bacterium]
MKTVLVTGGAGFIGSHLIERIINDCKVICLDNFDSFYERKVKEQNILALKSHSNFKLSEADIREFLSLKKVFDENKIDCIVHLAAKAGVRPSLLDPEGYVKTNINGTLNLLELAKEHKISKFIFGSSSSVYGSAPELVPFREDIPTAKPVSPYAATKSAGEQICHVYHHLYGMQIICLRFFTVYGPRQRPDLAIHKFAKLISQDKPITMFGDGNTSRDYTYVDDIIDGLTAAINLENTGFEILNLGVSRTVKLNYLIEVLEKALFKKAIIQKEGYQPGDVQITYANVEKAKSLLGFEPKVAIEEGIQRFVEWFRK